MDKPKDSTSGGPLPGLLRPPIVFFSMIILGVLMNLLWPIAWVPPPLVRIGPMAAFVAAVFFALSLREFRAAGTSVRGTERTSTIVMTGPYGFSRNPIYVSFILLQLGLAIWMNNLWLLVTLIPAAGFIALVVIPREESFLERNFQNQYSQYRQTVRRWL
jgi:protein-S-isoprenylcysteine O-methyltransferase Ste14